MKLPILASVAVVLLSAIPGVFSEEPSIAVAKPIESFAGVLAAVADDKAADLIGDESDVEEQGQMVAGKSGKRRRRRRSRTRRRRSRNSRRRRRGMCGARMRRSDRRTCRSLRRDFCESRRERRRNRSMCRHLGFRTLAAGAAEDAIETFAEDNEVFSEETQREVDMIVDDYEAELEDSEDASEDSEDYDSEDSEDYDAELWERRDRERRDRIGRRDRSSSRSERRRRSNGRNQRDSEGNFPRGSQCWDVYDPCFCDNRCDEVPAKADDKTGVSVQ